MANIEVVKIRKKNTYKKARPIAAETYYGNMEYKLQILHDLESYRVEQLTTQLLFRINQGNGVAIYNIGYTDEGEPDGIDFDTLLQSCSILRKMATNIGAEIKSMKILKGWTGHVANIYISLDPYDDRLFPDFDF